MKGIHNETMIYNANSLSLQFNRISSD